MPGKCLLDLHCGDKNAAMVTIISGRRHLKLTGASSHDKLEGLAQAVQQAGTSLRHVGAEALLASDFTLIGCLITKLPYNYGNRWDDYAAGAGGDVTWDLFKGWLARIRGAARVTRTRENKEVVSPSLRQVHYKEFDQNWQIWL